ncbi:MAG: GNAT family N-acetyltransferase [Bacteroidetes bacterium]|nr:GNAT family N-acetyltransferase [Bacteroidota bacterium]
MQISIRRANENDIETVYGFLCLLSDKTYNRQLFEDVYKQNIADERNIYLVAEIDNSVVGFLSCHGQLLLHHNGWVYEIQEMYTDEIYRGQGIGKALLHKMERILSERKYDMIDVTSNNKRKEAHAFYLKNGYVQTHQKFTKKGNI